MEPGAAAAEDRARGARRGDRERPEGGRGRPVSRRRGAGVARALARQPQGAGAGSRRMKDFIAKLAAGKIRVVDLSETLSPEFPAISLPPEFGQAAPFRIEEVSRYDERGPAWYWNNFSCGEHTGTHFDAPVHWVSGKDLPANAVDTIPPERFIGPAFVVDCSSDAQKDADFLLKKEHLLN